MLGHSHHLYLFLFLSALIVFYDDLVLVIHSIRKDSAKLLRLEISRKIFSEQGEDLNITYKDFSKIFEFLLEMKREQGINIESSLRKLRDLLTFEMKLQRKKKDRLITAIYQMLFLAIFISIYSGFMVYEFSFDGSIFIFILVCFLVGALALSFILKFYLEFLLNKILFFLVEIFKLMVLLKSSLSIQDILEFIDLKKLEKFSDNKIAMQKNLFFELLEKFRSQGENIEQEIFMIKGELEYEIQDRFQKFDDHSKALKMFFVILFILPPFFLINFMIIDNIFL